MMAYPGLTLVTAPTFEPFELGDIKLHLDIAEADSSHDELAQMLIVAAREYFEQQTHRQIITATFDQKLDGFPSGDNIRLVKPPLQSVTSVTYLDGSGDSQTMSSANYRVLTDREPGEIELAYGQSWPSTRGISEDVTIRFICGYGDDPEDVEKLMRQGMMTMIRHWFENRSAVVAVQGMTVTEVPLSAGHVVNMYRYGDAFTEYATSRN